MKQYWLLLFIFITGMTFLYGLPGREEIRKLNENIENLNEQFILPSQIDTVINIQRQADLYQSENTELKNEVAVLRLENERLYARIEELIKIIIRLQR